MHHRGAVSSRSGHVFCWQSASVVVAHRHGRREVAPEKPDGEILSKVILGGFVTAVVQTHEHGSVVVAVGVFDACDMSDDNE